MRWESSTTRNGNEIYQLIRDEKIILTLTVNPFSKTARIECDQQKRIFQIRKEGFRRHRTVIRNEYGLKIGELGHENKDLFITVNNERFFYSIENNPNPELILFKESKENPFVACSLSVEEGNAEVSFTKNKKLLSETSHPGLLMALCWYMFLPVTKETLPEPVRMD